jgi:hypothetical protein
VNLKFFSQHGRDTLRDPFKTLSTRYRMSSILNKTQSTVVGLFICLKNTFIKLEGSMTSR